MEMAKLLEECFVLIIYVVPYEVSILSADISDSSLSLHGYFSEVVGGILV